MYIRKKNFLSFCKLRQCHSQAVHHPAVNMRTEFYCESFLATTFAKFEGHGLACGSCDGNHFIHLDELKRAISRWRQAHVCRYCFKIYKYINVSTFVFRETDGIFRNNMFCLLLSSVKIRQFHESEKNMLSFFSVPNSTYLLRKAYYWVTSKQ